MVANSTHIKKTDKQTEAFDSNKGENKNGRLQSKNYPNIYKVDKCFYYIYDGKHHPSETGKEDIERFLTHLAANRNVSAPTQNQTLSTEKYYENKIK